MLFFLIYKNNVKVEIHYKVKKNTTDLRNCLNWLIFKTITRQIFDIGENSFLRKGS